MDSETRTRIRFARSEIMRARADKRQVLSTHEEMVAEIDSAIAFARSNPFREDGYVRPRDAKGHFVAVAA